MFKTASTQTKILGVFCGTEVWERYGFYVVQALLALYLSFELKLSDVQIYALVGSFTALTYISPVVGGSIADRLIGQKRAVLLGAAILSLSYIAMSFVETLQTLLPSLALASIGTGLLKPNISAMLGKQYKVGDPKRNSGFTIFYLGITAGIILGTVLPFKLQTFLGWKACFISAAIGAAFAYFVFYFGARKLNIKEYTIISPNMFANWCMAGAILLLAFLVFYGVLLHPSLANMFFLVIVAIAVGMVLRIARKEAGRQRYKTLSLLLLFVISVFFWAFYFEMFILLTLFITRLVEPTIFGITFPAPYYVALQSFGMVVFGLLLSKLWARLKYQNVAYATGVKFTLSMLCMLIAYGIIFLLLSSNMTNALLSVWPVLIAYLMISLAELLLSPIGLSAVTQLASEKVVSTMMGLFFVSLGIGGFFSGKLAELAVVNGGLGSILETKEQYLAGFEKLLMILFGALILAGVLAFIIQRLTRKGPNE